MTTNNGAGGLPELPERFDHLIVDGFNDESVDVYTADQMRAYAKAALQAPGEAVGWAPESVAEHAIRALIVAGHVPQEKADQALRIAAKFRAHDTTPPPSDVLRRVVERAAEEIEQGHTWISATAASAIIRKHILAAHKALAEGEMK